MKKVLTQIVIIAASVLLTGISATATQYSIAQPVPTDWMGGLPLGTTMSGYYILGENYDPVQIDNAGISALNFGSSSAWNFMVTPNSGPSGEKVYLDVAFDVHTRFGDIDIYGDPVSPLVPDDFCAKVKNNVYFTDVSSFTNMGAIVDEYTHLNEYGAQYEIYNHQDATPYWGDTTTDGMINLTLEVQTGQYYLLDTYIDWDFVVSEEHKGSGISNFLLGDSIQLASCNIRPVTDPAAIQDISSVPEPATMLLLGCAFGGLLVGLGLMKSRII